MSQIAIAFHRISPSVFHPILIVAVRLTFLHLLFGLLFQQYHPSQNDGVLKFCHSMINSHVNDIWLIRQLEELL